MVLFKSLISESVSVEMSYLSIFSDLSWLSNRSYTEETEKKLVKFQEELEQYQKKLRYDGS